jgi:predicted RNase H-like nuclease
MRVTGVDACRGGWVAVTWNANTSGTTGTVAGGTPRLTVTVARTLGQLPLSPVTGVDMPLGLLGNRWRTADVLARRALGRRGSTVFAVPPRPVWERETYAEANALCKQLTGRGMSAQAWGLRTRILEADQFRRSSATTLPKGVLHEVHPELAFAAMAGAPVPVSKHTVEGLTVRRELLTAAGIEPPAGPVPGARADDVLDAAAVAWSAARIADDTAVTLTDPEQRADDGGEIAIRY